MKMEVCILPLGEVEGRILAFLNAKLSKIFGSARILGRLEIPEPAFNPLRMQYNSTIILYSLPIPSRCDVVLAVLDVDIYACLLYTSPSPRDGLLSRMPSSA